MAETSATDKGSHPELPFKCLALDLEVTKQNQRVAAFAAVRSSDGESFHRKFGGKIKHSDWKQLDAFAGDTEVLVGHNLIAHDVPYLQAEAPELKLLGLPPLDTLRLSPLAFPRHPYHSLVKHYKSGDIVRVACNDPELDCRASLRLLADEIEAFRAIDANLLTAYHWLTTRDSNAAGFDRFFASVRGKTCPTRADVITAMRKRLENVSCSTHGRKLFGDAAQDGWPLAYALAWLSVAGSNSVMPPWVRHQFPQAGALVRRLRDTACTEADCNWCREHHDANKELKRWFGFDGFRPEPRDASGKPMQQAIVESVMAGDHALGILPTGTGKSLCYQIPALSRYDKTGALTVVISPLVALMADQVTSLEKLGIESGATVNGTLSLPERRDALDRVQLGDAGIVLISPEQLRSGVVCKALEQREVGLWVLDEAHCLSRWGHDFRPDYRYIAKFIKQKTELQAGYQPPVLCLTATAKPEVVNEIRAYFRKKLGIELRLFDGGARRENLDFVVVRTTAAEKYDHISQVLVSDLPPDTPGGAIIYCSTKRRTEEIAEFLRESGVDADFYHAGLQPETKKSVQKAFTGGELRVIVATNAFGMGIDKPDVRLVIHADIPGSLENYLQEAGRAGRDRAAARCILLYTPDDVERQFGLSARSRLTRHEIHGILRALRNLDKRKKKKGEIVATSGEILGEDDDAAFERDALTDDTRVRTAVAWLEEAQLLTREENLVHVFPSSLRVNSIEGARERIENGIELHDYRKQLLQIAGRLIDADPEEGITTDELMHVTGLKSEQVGKALYDLERLGIANNDTALTAYVHKGVANSSLKRLEAARSMEISLIDEMRELSPDLKKGDSENLNLRVTTQRLKDLGHEEALPERVMRLLRGLVGDGRDDSSRKGSISVGRRSGHDSIRLTLNRDWSALRETAGRRHAAAQCLLQHLLSRLDKGSQGVDLLAETTLGSLLAAIESDLALKSRAHDTRKLMDRTLLWLNELQIITLNKGLAVFRQAMTIQLGKDWKSGFGNREFEPLKHHYQDRMLQIHVMEEYAQKGIGEIADALALAMDYFELEKEEFLARWLPNRETEIGRQMTPDSWRKIVESLGNPEQERIVADKHEQTSALVLAGPGSGKTRVLVHRIAWLLRARRERPGSIIALAYNRHAAVDIRKRLTDMVGDDAKGVAVMTCHSLAMRLLGASFSVRADAAGEARKRKPDDDSFTEVLRQAVSLLQGEGLPPEDLDENRQRLLAGFRWILVDEYQDIGPDEYALISALSGRKLKEEQDRLSLFAVGDDDQNIYSYAGASVEYICRFESDYDAKRAYLIDNYRSTANIVEAANALIAPAQNRMKPDHPIQINADRRGNPPGGEWREIDPVARGRVQILHCDDTASQARTALRELRRLAALAGPDWDWSKCAVIAREWKFLDPVRAACELEGIETQVGNEQFRGFWRLRETRALLAWLRERRPRIVDAAAVRRWLDEQEPGRWNELLREAVAEYADESGEGETPVENFVEWLAEWGRDARGRQRGLLLSTAHRAKGLEFDHVIVLDGGWVKRSPGEDRDALRRLVYVAMTRARHTLALARMANETNPFVDELGRLPAVLQRGGLGDNSSAAVQESPGMYAVGDGLELMARYRRLDLEKVDLGFAGRQAARNPVHRAIGALKPGDALELRASAHSAVRNSRWELYDASGHRVGRLSAKFAHPAGERCCRALVYAVVQWSKAQSEPEYHDGIRCDREWEVVIPELVFLPDD
ncbi:MAG: RecQ family ATP-dependent DNA helicase [Gammaproteobacteria bacterium]|nr:RecQ family ATP-dependent DNA helicase [Gammaproteobacteria bacterium]